MIVMEWENLTSVIWIPVLCSPIARTDALGKNVKVLRVMVETKRFLNADQLSELLGVRKDTLYRFVSQRRIPHIKIGRRTRFNPEKIMEWIEANSVAAKDFS